MPKKLIKRYTPNPETLKNHKHLKIFGRLLQDANLWHLNRRSAAGAFAVGLFMCWIPLPSQMVMAAGLAILFRVNLPLSVALVWVSNPITMPPMFYFAYRIGAYCLQQPIQHWHFELSWQWLGEMIHTIGPALMLGCGMLAVLSAGLGYFIVHWLWTLSILRYRSRRRARKPNKK